MKKFIVGSATVASTLAGFAPVVLAVQKNISNPNENIGTSGLAAFITQVNRVINYIVPFLVGIAVLVVIYGIFGYIKNADNEEKRALGRAMMIWGTLGIFMMLSIWGLVSILDNTFSFEKSGQYIDKPQFDVVGAVSNAGGNQNNYNPYPPNYNNPDNPDD